ncbi:hypothetical protein [Desulfobaculum bizertense]|uniref:Uncharacterized protein n=1 Tax=Desulfobaculum bizertense DSM 18034 TaxID=1121442 RepID=A0A1T4W914_9BACT|nr:hypothetical protein [Desulfobaculum bizertense]UIJ39237.1 hypothetical protein LWC08_06605 [Desulfobaculum bizertense]SKA73772.1 hypothetical protein SAMN02745702_01915 [Desulfobaculum bizertense DSM 18034]
MPSRVVVTKMLQCEVCGETFSKSYGQCPKCGSEDFVGYKMLNPVARIPMEQVLIVVAHLSWILGTIACIAMLWSTGGEDQTFDLLMMFGGVATLIFSFILSVALFALGEILGRTIRIQRRVKAFVNNYWENQG